LAVSAVIVLTAVREGRADPPPDRVLTIDFVTGLDFVDPALGFFNPTWQAEQATCALLVNYGDESGPSAVRLRPEIATGMPTVSPDGRVYTFTLRDDFHFSPPSGAAVTALAFKRTFERTLHQQMASPAQPFFDDIEGAKEVIAGQQTEISGIVASGQTLSFTLEEPAADFLNRLALPFACPLPIGTAVTPNGLAAPIPGTGPYYISAYEGQNSMLLLANPNYGGERPQRFDEIRYRFGLPLEQIRTSIEAGTTDYGPVPPASHEELETLYGPGSAAEAAGNQQWFPFVGPILRYLALNHDRPLFGDADADTDLDPLGNVRLKQAVNYAIDRTALAAAFGHKAGFPYDHYLTSVFPGAQDVSLYPDVPDIATAQELAGWDPSKPMRPAVMYTFSTPPGPTVANIVKDNLAEIGLDVQIQAFPRAIQFTKAGTRGEPFDITLEAWFPNYFDSGNVLFLLDGTTIKATNNTNFSYFNDPGYNAAFAAANALTGTARQQALGELDVVTARDKAPMAAFMGGNVREFFSRRIGCQQFGPQEASVRLVTLCIRPEISVDDVGLDEDEEATFTVRLSSEQTGQVTVGYQTADGTAVAGQDYTASSGTLTFAPGQRSKPVVVDVIDDGTAEPDEHFRLVLSAPSTGTLVDAEARATIAASDNGGGPPPPPPPGPPPPGPPPPPPAPPPAPPPPLPRAPQASVGSGAVTVAGNVAPVPLTCTGSVACKGVADLFASGPQLKILAADARTKLGSGRFAIAARKKGKIRIRLTRRGAQLVRRKGRIRVQIVVSLQRRGARPKVMRKTITLVTKRR
jgi:peptide/nickel transport system substrate-binding protein